MDEADYYHEIAVAAKRIADDHWGEVKAGVDAGETDRAADDVEKAAKEAAHHRVFRDTLGDLWTLTATSPDEAAFLGRILAVSNARFPDRVEGRPPGVLKDAAAETLRADIKRGAFGILRQRVRDYESDTTEA